MISVKKYLICLILFSVSYFIFSSEILADQCGAEDICVHFMLDKPEDVNLYIDTHIYLKNGTEDCNYVMQIFSKKESFIDLPINVSGIDGIVPNHRYPLKDIDHIRVSVYRTVEGMGKNVIIFKDKSPCTHTVLISWNPRTKWRAELVN